MRREEPLRLSRLSKNYNKSSKRKNKKSPHWPMNCGVFGKVGQYFFLALLAVGFELKKSERDLFVG
ncbi:hypothetical protein AKJ17_17240 [Vibrio nereis]|uniref:Uncharacterized protein n=1 Tax=Vibrio nereis TaxID=693 RepID=A0A0M0HJL1_VIBNE|nr:hypothetical protein AKJ17_17240 [Vibrio nereis]